MSVQLRADNRAPGMARAFLERVLADTSVTDALREDLLLIASELVTNAVKSGASRVEIDLDQSPERLVLVVEDDGAGWPTLLHAQELDTSGRGLFIVDHLADEWEVHPRETGKRVKAVLVADNVRGSGRRHHT